MNHYHPTFLFCHPKPVLSSWRFHPSLPPLPFPAIPSLQRFPTPEWEALGCRSRATEEGALHELKVGQLCASDQANEQVQHLLPLLGILRCPRRVLPSCQWLAPLKQPRPRSCGRKSCVVLAVLYLFVTCLVTKATYLSYS